MQIVDVEQGTPEWLEARLGIVTMSRAQCLLVKGKRPNGLGADAITYMFQLIAERFTGEIGDNFAGNVHTERGHALEPIARELYTEVTGLPVEETGIVLNHGVGYSPDGLVGDNGLIEIKTKLPGKMAAMLYDGVVPKESTWRRFKAAYGSVSVNGWTSWATGPACRCSCNGYIGMRRSSRHWLTACAASMTR